MIATAATPMQCQEEEGAGDDDFDVLLHFDVCLLKMK
jgi:hypothetical protein